MATIGWIDFNVEMFQLCQIKARLLPRLIIVKLGKKEEIVNDDIKQSQICQII